MKKILLSFSEDFIDAIDSYCKKYNYERSEFIRQATREIIYPKDISKPRGEVKTEIREVQKEEIKKDELELQKQEKLSKARDLLNSLPRQSKAPLFCPKHSGSRIGGNYTCGCIV